MSDLESSSATIPLEEFPSDLSPASNPEAHGDDQGDGHSAGITTSPPLGVKLTVYRLLNVTGIFVFCIQKDILTYKGQLITPTTLDLVSGVVAGMLYWIGLYEGCAKRLEWFFQFDLAPPIGSCTKWVVAEAKGALFFLDGLFVIISLSNLLGNLAVILLLRFVPGYLSSSALWGVYFGAVVCAHFLWYSTIRLVRACVKRSTTVCRPAPPAEQRGRLPVAARTTVTLICVVTLIGLSHAIYVYLAWRPLCVRHDKAFTLCDDATKVCGDPMINRTVNIRCIRSVAALWDRALHSRWYPSKGVISIKDFRKLTLYH